MQHSNFCTEMGIRMKTIPQGLHFMHFKSGTQMWKMSFCLCHFPFHFQVRVIFTAMLHWVWQNSLLFIRKLKTHGPWSVCHRRLYWTPVVIFYRHFGPCRSKQKKDINSCRAFQSEYCLDSLQGPLKYYTIKTVTLQVRLKWVSSLNCLVHGHGPWLDWSQLAAAAWGGLGGQEAALLRQLCCSKSVSSRL